MKALLRSFGALLDPTAGGDARLAIKVISLVTPIIVALAAPLQAAVGAGAAAGVIQVILGWLTHETAVGNVPPPAPLVGVTPIPPKLGA